MTFSEHTINTLRKHIAARSNTAPQYVLQQNGSHLHTLSCDSSKTRAVVESFPEITHVCNFSKLLEGDCGQLLENWISGPLAKSSRQMMLQIVFYTSCFSEALEFVLLLLSHTTRPLPLVRKSRQSAGEYVENDSHVHSSIRRQNVVMSFLMIQRNSALSCTQEIWLKSVN